MTFRITGVETKNSKFGGLFTYVFFRSDEPRSVKTCLDPRNRNYKRWEPLIAKYRAGNEVFVENLKFKRGDLVDADSLFMEVVNVNN